MLGVSVCFSADSFTSSSSSEDSSLLKVFESESVVAEDGFSVDSGSPSGFSSSDLSGDTWTLGCIEDKLSGSKDGSGSGFSVGSGSDGFSCGSSSVEA